MTPKKPTAFRSIFDALKRILWDTSLHQLSGWRRRGVKLIKIPFHAVRKFAHDELYLRAPALSFFTLLTIVPFLAVAFGIAKGFDLQNVLEAQIKKNLALHGEVEAILIDFARNTLQQARGGLVAGLGIIFLFFTVTFLLSNIEESFNRIWGVQRARRLSVKIRDYFSMIFIGTILLLVSLSLSVAASDIPSFFGYLHTVLAFLVSLVPFIIVWLLFAFLIIFMPNTRVSFGAGLWGGIISGTLYQLLFNFYIRLQVTVSVYNAIYGSFAALPLLLLWLQVSWLSLLFGAEIAYTYDNVENLEIKTSYTDLSARMRKLLMLRILQHLTRHFTDMKPAPSAKNIARDLGIPIQLVNQTLVDLVAMGLAAEVNLPGKDDFGYQPAVSVEVLTVQKVLETADRYGLTEIPIKDSPQIQRIEELLRQTDELLEQSPSNLRLTEI